MTKVHRTTRQGQVIDACEEYILDSVDAVNLQLVFVDWVDTYRIWVVTMKYQIDGNEKWYWLEMFVDDRGTDVMGHRDYTPAF